MTAPARRSGVDRRAQRCRRQRPPPPIRLTNAAPGAFLAVHMLRLTARHAAGATRGLAAATLPALLRCASAVVDQAPVPASVGSKQLHTSAARCAGLAAWAGRRSAAPLPCARLSWTCGTSQHAFRKHPRSAAVAQTPPIGAAAPPPPPPPKRQPPGSALACFAQPLQHEDLHKDRRRRRLVPLLGRAAAKGERLLGRRTSVVGWGGGRRRSDASRVVAQPA